MGEKKDRISVGQGSGMEGRRSGFSAAGRPLSRRQFVQDAAVTLSGLSMLGSSFAIPLSPGAAFAAQADMLDQENISVIGLYGPWAASLVEDKPPAVSFRGEKWSDLEAWRSVEEAVRNAGRFIVERVVV